MEYKFKVGDTVKVKKELVDNYEAIDKFRGKTGVITQVTGQDYPYHVAVDGDTQPFLADELELVPDITEATPDVPLGAWGTTL